ncbi:MAG: SGNH/GDSL hydrolase family protein [Acidobacteriota bacterium]
MTTISCEKLGLGNAGNPTGPDPIPPPAAGATIIYAAIGASDALGVGSSLPCLPFVDCAEGTGYVQVAARQLRTQGFSVTVSNLGLPTSVIGRDFELLGRQYDRQILGNFIDQQLPLVRQDTTLVSVFAGGNEVNTITAALGGGAGASDPAAYIDRQVAAFGADYATLLQGVRSQTTAARIVVLNVPNLAGLPFLAGVTLAQRQAAQRAAVGMTTTVVNALTAQAVTVVDLMCDQRSYQTSNYSSDGFHPNDAGYAFIAAEVVLAATSASYPPPRGNCPQMTIVPPP